MSLHFVLGSRDHEMEAIESLLTQLGISFSHAMKTADPKGNPLPASRRVFPGERADFAGISSGETLKQIITVEVQCLDLQMENTPFYEIDHHGEHPAASLPVGQYLEASSIGQVIICLAQEGIVSAAWAFESGVQSLKTGDWLRPGDIAAYASHPVNHTGTKPGYPAVVAVAGQVTPGDGYQIPKEILWVAAADHCLGAACQGLCPGVDFSEGTLGRAWLLESRRKVFAPSMSNEEFAMAVSIAELEVRTASSVPDMGGNVADLRQLPIDGPVVNATGEQYPSRAQFLPLVASMVGRPYMVHIKGKHGLALRMGGGDGRFIQPFSEFFNNPEKFGCLPTSAPAPTNAYASPVRGFAGGTLM